MDISSVLTSFSEFVSSQLASCGCPVPCTSLISHTAPPLDCCDLLAVYLGELSSVDLENLSACSTFPVFPVNVEAWYCVEDLSVYNNKISVKAAECRSNEALELVKVGQVLHGAAHSFFSDTCSYYTEAITSFPLEPQGGCAGWRTEILVRES